MIKTKKTRFLAAFLALCSIFTLALSGCKKTPDNEEPEEEDEYMTGHTVYLDYVTKFDTENTYYLLAPGEESDYALTGVLTPNYDITAEGSSVSGYWHDQTVQQSVDFPYVPQDLTMYDALVMNVYSEKATGAGFTFCIYCQWSATDSKTSYRKYAGTIDWTGWKQIIIPINEMQPAYSPNLRMVSSIEWNASGWNNTPSKESQLYFDSMFLTNLSYDYTIPLDTIGEYNYDHIVDTLVKFLIGGVSIDRADEYSKK